MSILENIAIALVVIGGLVFISCMTEVWKMYSSTVKGTRENAAVKRLKSDSGATINNNAVNNVPKGLD